MGGKSIRKEESSSMCCEEARSRGAYEIDTIMPDGRFLHQWLAVLGCKEMDKYREDGIVPEVLERASWETAKYGAPFFPIELPF